MARNRAHKRQPPLNAMNPALIIAAIDGAIALIEKLTPLVQHLFQKGEITVEQQQTLAKRMEDLDRLDLFNAPEWRVDKDVPPLP